MILYSIYLDTQNIFKMRFILTVFLSLSLLQLFAQGFRGHEWGTTMDIVVETDEANKYEGFSCDHGLCDGYIYLLEEVVMVTFKSVNNKLVSGGYWYTTQNERQAVEYYKKIVSQLSFKYKDFNHFKRTTWNDKIEWNDFSSFAFGALARGEIAYESTYKDDVTTINLSLDCQKYGQEGFSCNCSLNYDSSKYLLDKKKANSRDF